jgi:quercetin dioxygenase-like cupin family protein
LPELRLTVSEAQTSERGDTQIGSGGLKGEHTKVLYGDPSKAGLYSILLFVPAHTTIQAHSHRGDRMATVLSGAWRFGYGEHFDANALKSLPPGSVYSEPAGRHHFAQTVDEAVIVQISGIGPTDTHYFDVAQAPKGSGR